MDGLQDQERALAWEASWHPSFEGTAIVNEDFTFRSVNPQFCEVVGVSPAELIGKRFQDMTPPPVKQLDENNAKLVVRGVIDSYLLPKTYQFDNGKTVHVVLLVKGVYDENKKFLFFVSKIMLDYERQPKSGSAARSQEPQGVIEFLSKNSKLLAAIGAVLTFVIAGTLKAAGLI